MDPHPDVWRPTPLQHSVLVIAGEGEGISMIENRHKRKDSAPGWRGKGGKIKRHGGAVHTTSQWRAARCSAASNRSESAVTARSSEFNQLFLWCSAHFARQPPILWNSSTEPRMLARVLPSAQAGPWHPGAADELPWQPVGLNATRDRRIERGTDPPGCPGHPAHEQFPPDRPQDRLSAAARWMSGCQSVTWLGSLWR